MRRGMACLFLLTALATAAPSIHAAKPDERRKPDYLSLVVAAYRPEYPYEARRDHVTGTGRVVMHIERSTGKVISCEMELSTGSRILDEAVLDAFRQWRFKPRTIAGARVPITFSMSGQVL